MSDEAHPVGETFSMYLPFWILAHELPDGRRPPVCSPHILHSPVVLGNDSGKYGRSIALYTAEDLAMSGAEQYARMPGAVPGVYALRIEDAADLVGLVSCAGQSGVSSFAFDPGFLPEIPDFRARFRSLDMMREAMGTLELVPVGHHG